MTAEGGVISNAANAALLALRPFTIIRTRGVLFLHSDQAAAVENQIAAFAGAVVSEQALAIGITAVPSPIVELGSDFFFLHQLIMARENAVANQTEPGTFVQFDSKAMRKVNEDEEPYFVKDMSVIGSGVVLISAARMLIKLH